MFMLIASVFIFGNHFMATKRQGVCSKKKPLMLFGKINTSGFCVKGLGLL